MMTPVPRRVRLAPALAAATLIAGLVVAGVLTASDHQDSVLAELNPKYDVNDVYAFPAATPGRIVNHDRHNRTQPYDTAEFLPQTAAFVTSFGRPFELAQLLGSVLYPDILIVNTARNPSTAGWLSWVIPGVDGWGGRTLSDDVVDLGLTAIFSSFLNPAGALCPPFQLPLCTDNVDANDKTFLPVFPYLASPAL